ncbi:MAG: aspartyl/asparaginyl beta-hydroxylase domain-containing protein [Pseudomonadota bacterium]|nr:aspartyl/asparaginyl beta-hydroxylase domain-containing protein [Pseudomonadota bacterium]
MLADDETAIDQLIAREPSNVAALIRKADLRVSAGDEKGATGFYMAALKAAAQQPASGASAGDLARAEAACQRSFRRFEEYLEDSLTRAGFGPTQRPQRFQESIDIVMGRRSAVSSIQQPRTYFYPGLPQRRYYERHEFPWAAELEKQTDVIRQEVLELVKDEGQFIPYLVSDPSRPPFEHHGGLIDNPDWSTFLLWDKGAPVAENAARCPQTLATLERLDLVHVPKRAPCIMFSKLKAGASIPLHTGLLNMRLVCHLGLIVPDDCTFLVGGEARQWHEGEIMVFDDSVAHQAFNNSDRDRIVLIFEIWRPELNPDERRAMTAVFEAIDSYQS